MTQANPLRRLLRRFIIPGFALSGALGLTLFSHNSLRLNLFSPTTNVGEINFNDNGRLEPSSAQPESEEATPLEPIITVTLPITPEISVSTNDSTNLELGDIQLNLPSSSAPTIQVNPKIDLNNGSSVELPPQSFWQETGLDFRSSTTWQLTPSRFPTISGSQPMAWTSSSMTVSSPPHTETQWVELKAPYSGQAQHSADERGTFSLYSDSLVFPTAQSPVAAVEAPLMGGLALFTIGWLVIGQTHKSC